MSGIATESNYSTGDCGRPPTLPIGPMTSSSCTLGGKRILWRGITVYESHPPLVTQDRKSTRLNSSHSQQSRMPSSA